MRKIIDERTFDNVVVQDRNGNVVHNAMQQDDPVIRRKYDDGIITVTSSKTGKHIVPPYRMNKEYEHMIPAKDWEES